MSYFLSVEVKDGQAVVSTATNLPDGKIHVNGHEDAEYASISVHRNEPGGKQVAQASATVRH